MKVIKHGYVNTNKAQQLILLLNLKENDIVICESNVYQAQYDPTSEDENFLSMSELEKFSYLEYRHKIMSMSTDIDKCLIEQDLVYFVPSLFLREEKNRAIYSCLILRRFHNEILAYGEIEMVLGKESSNDQNMTRSGWMGLGKGYH